jgi:hypothetical protein
MGASPEGVAISQGTRAVRDFFYMIKRARLLELSPARQRDNGDCRAPRGPDYKFALLQDPGFNLKGRYWGRLLSRIRSNPWWTFK